MTKTEYQQYLLSDHWLKQRLTAFQHYGNTCNRCDRFATDVHHRTYSRLGRELMSDLELLCRKCHEAEHAKDPLKAKARKQSRKRKNRKYVTGVKRWQNRQTAIRKLSKATGYSYEFLKDLKTGELNRLRDKYKVKVEVFKKTGNTSVERKPFWNSVSC
jgi:hypothetical protein